MLLSNVSLYFFFISLTLFNLGGEGGGGGVPAPISTFENFLDI